MLCNAYVQFEIKIKILECITVSVGRSPRIPTGGWGFQSMLCPEKSSVADFLDTLTKTNSRSKEIVYEKSMKREI